MSRIPRLVGMVHLLPLPGSPRYGGDMALVLEKAAEDANRLAEAGFPALMVENFGDVPFFADSVPAETVAAMTFAVTTVKETTGLPLGINVLRNDVLSALGISAVSGAHFVRVNVLTGTMYTDQGPIVGRAAEIVRKRQTIAPDVEIWADVMVKHSTAPPGTDAGQTAIDTVGRGLADAVIVSGSGTGTEPDLSQAELIRSAIPKDTRLVIGSGATPDNLSRLTDVADTVIVGSSLKVDGDASNRVDAARAAAFVEQASKLGLV